MRDARILIVAADEPDAAGSAHLKRRLQEMGHTVCAAVAPARRGGADAAVAAAARTRPDLAVVDLGADGAGSAVAERLASELDLPLVYLTDAADGDRLQRARRTEPFGYVLKPIAERQLQQLRLTIDAALATHERDRERRRVIAGLQRQTRRLEAIINSLSDGVVVTGTDGTFLFVNPAAEQAVGKGATDTMPEQWAETYGTFYPDGKTPFPSERLPLVRAMHGEISDDVELFIRNPQRPDGVYISVNARPLRVENGTEGGVIVFRDITRLKETEAKLHRTIADLRRQTQLMETIFNSISDGVLVSDERGELYIFNAGAERISGPGYPGLGPEQWAEAYGLFRPDRVTLLPTEELPLVRAIRGEASDDVTVFVRNRHKPDGVYLSVSGRPLQGESGTKGGVVVFRDVTEQVLMEESLSRAFAQGRLEVVETILHNIGNAINSVAIGVGTIRERLVDNELILRMFAVADALRAHQDDWLTYLQRDPQGRQALPFIIALAQDLGGWHERLRETAERVEGRVAHIVDIIRTQRSFDHESMSRKEIDLRAAVVAAVRLLEDSLTRRGIETRIDCRRAPREIRIQESAFHQMLVNLVRNAMEAVDRLAQAGGRAAQPCIRIVACVREDDLVLDVIDNGIGIEPEGATKIFAAGYTTKEGGSGIGLHSAANFVIGSGGSIRALSDGTGTGTTIRVAWPAASLAVSDASPPPPRRGLHLTSGR